MKDKPLLLVNFKAYEEAIGERGLKIAKIIEKIAGQSNANVAIAVQVAEIEKFASAVSIPVYSQHADGMQFGAYTGWILPETIKSAGAVGTMLNHTEHQMDMDRLRAAIERSKEVGLKTVVCANTPDIAKSIAKFSPDYIAVEPPELIGGNISISQAKPEIISNSVKSVGRIPLLAGAGVKTKDDVRKAIQLGAAGVLVASGVTKALNVEKAVKDFVAGL
jgi:triosephosphate isomerase